MLTKYNQVIKKTETYSTLYRKRILSSLLWKSCVHKEHSVLACSFVCLCMCMLVLRDRSMLVQTNYATRSRQATCPSSDVFFMLTLYPASGTLPTRNHTKAAVLSFFFYYKFFILLFFLPHAFFHLDWLGYFLALFKPND